MDIDLHAAAANEESGALPPLDDLCGRILSPASFWFPERSGAASGWTEHAPFAFWLVGAHRPRCFVELGTHTGYSYSAVCQAVRDLGLGTRCYAVDTWRGDKHAGFYGPEVYEELSRFNNARFGEFSTLIRSTFSEALEHFEDESIDLLHIDGAHQYEDVKTDFEQWTRKLVPDAIVLFHDINVRERQFGVFKLWNEIKSCRPHFEFWHGNGLGILGMGDRFSPEMQTLFDCSASQSLAGPVRAAYSRLGSALTILYTGAKTNEAKLQELADVRGELAQLTSANASLQEELTLALDATNNLKAERASLTQRLSRHSSRLNYLHALLGTRTYQVEDLDRRLDEAKRELAALEDERRRRDRAEHLIRRMSVVNRDAVIDRLTAELRNQRARAYTLEKEASHGGLFDRGKDQSPAILKKELSQVRAQCEDLSARLAGIMDSNAWRLMGMVRRVARLVR